MRSLTSSSSRRAGRLLGTAVGVAALGLAAACGNDPAPAATPPATAAPASAAPAGQSGGHDMAGMQGDMPGMDMNNGGVALYAVQTGKLGIVAADGAGHLLYGSTGDADNPSTSRCTGSCAQEWQPVVIPKGQQPELLGVDGKKIGALARPDGSSQLTLSGWPVYTNSGDDGRLTAVAPDAHGLWFAFTPQGQKINL